MSRFNSIISKLYNRKVFLTLLSIISLLIILFVTLHFTVFTAKNGCIPSIKYNLEGEYQFNPEEIQSFDLKIVDYYKDNTLNFKRHDQSMITIETQILASSRSLFNLINVNEKKTNKKYSYNVEASGSTYNECLTAKIMIGLPKDLKSFNELILNTERTISNVDFTTPLSIKNLTLNIRRGRFNVKDQNVDNMHILLDRGELDLDNVISNKFLLNVTRSQMNGNKIDADEFHSKCSRSQVGLEISKSKDIILEAESSELKFKANNIQNIQNNVDKSSFQLSINNVTNVNIKAMHSTITLNVIEQSKVLDNSYSIDSEKGGVKIGLPSTFTGRFNLDATDGLIDLNNDNSKANFRLTKDENKSKAGYINDEDSKSFIKAKNFKGNIELDIK